MHVLIAEGLVDRDYVDRYTIGFRGTRGARGRMDARARRARSAASPPRKSWRSRASTARRSRPRFASTTACSGVAGGGNAVRAIACLPALVGAWRDPAGGALLSSSGTYPVDHARARAARPDPRPAAHDQHERDRRRAARPRRPADPRDLRLQLEPGRRRARLGPRARGIRARGPLLRRARDLPDRHRRLRRHPAAGDHAARAVRRAHVVRAPVRAREQSGDRAARRSAAEHRGVPPSRRAHGLHRALLRRFRRDDGPRRRGSATTPPRATSISTRCCATAGSASTCPPRYAPFAQGNFPTPSGKCEFASATLAAQGHDPLPDYVPPRESAASNPELARRYPLAFISPPARNFLNTSFANLPAFARRGAHAAPRSQRGRRGAARHRRRRRACGSSTTAAASRRPRA